MSSATYPYLTWPEPKETKGLKYNHGAMWSGAQALPIEAREGFSFDVLESRFVVHEDDPKICKHLLTISSPDGPVSFCLDVELLERGER